MTYDQAKTQVALKHGYKSLVTGHKASLFDEAAELYAKSFWDDNKVIDFVNWYIELCKIDDRHELENQYIIDSFKKGDKASAWHMAEDQRLYNIKQAELTDSPSSMVYTGKNREEIIEWAEGNLSFSMIMQDNTGKHLYTHSQGMLILFNSTSKAQAVDWGDTVTKKPWSVIQQNPDSPSNIYINQQRSKPLQPDFWIPVDPNNLPEGHVIGALFNKEEPDLNHKMYGYFDKDYLPSLYFTDGEYRIDCTHYYPINQHDLV